MIKYLNDTQTACHYLDIGKRIRLVLHDSSEYCPWFGMGKFNNCDMAYMHVILFHVCIEFHYYKRYYD